MPGGNEAVPKSINASTCGPRLSNETISTSLDDLGRFNISIIYSSLKVYRGRHHNIGKSAADVGRDAISAHVSEKVIAQFDIPNAARCGSGKPPRHPFGVIRFIGQIVHLADQRPFVVIVIDPEARIHQIQILPRR